MRLVLSSNNFRHVQSVLGPRPGDKILDPFYLRKSIGDKPYFWNDDRKKWELVRIGDVFEINIDGSVSRIPVERSVA